jgi:hypothetical protein
MDFSGVVGVVREPRLEGIGGDGGTNANDLDSLASVSIILSNTGKTVTTVPEEGINGWWVGLVYQNSFGIVGRNVEAGPNGAVGGEKIEVGDVADTNVGRGQNPNIGSILVYLSTHKKCQTS